MLVQIWLENELHEFVVSCEIVFHSKNHMEISNILIFEEDCNINANESLVSLS